MNHFVLWADDGGAGWTVIGAALLMALLPAAFLTPLLYAVILRSGKAGYSRRAVQSVGIWLAAFAALCAAGVFAAFSYNSSEGLAAFRIITALFAVASWSLATIGVMYSLRGLRETDKKLKHRRRHGHRYAVGGCTLNVLTMLGLLVGGGYFGRQMFVDVEPATPGTSLEAAAVLHEATRTAAEALKNSPQSSYSPIAVPSGTAADIGSPPPTLVGPAPTPGATHVWFGTLFGGLPADTARDVGPTMLEYPALNFRLHSPGPGWARLDPARAGHGALAAFDKPSERLRLIVAAERPGIEQGATLDIAVEAARRRLTAIVPAMQITTATERTIGGVPGRAFSASGKQGDEMCAVEAWIAAHNGFVYQLLVLGSNPVAAAHVSEAQRLFELFEPLDAAQVAHAPEIAAPADSLTAVGLKFKLPDAWTASSEVVAEYPLADFAARHDAQTGFIAMAVRLDDGTPDRTAAAYALLTMAGVPYDRAAARPTKRRTQSSLSGDEFAWTQPGDAAGFRMARVFVGRGMAYLLLGWCDAEAGARFAALQAALDGAHMAGTSETTSKSPTGAKVHRSRSAQFYDEAGKYYVALGRAADAEPLFRSAVKLAPEQASYLADLVEVCVARRRFAEALNALDEHGAVADRSDALKLRRADVLAAAGRRDEALSAYAAVFREGQIDDKALTRYVEQLGNLGRWDEALATVAAYRTRRNTPALFALEASLLAGRGDKFAAAKTLERHLARSPTDAEPTFALADVYRRMQRPEDALTTIERLIAAGAPSWTAHYWKGLAEYDLRRTRSARDSFAEAHRLNPTDAPTKQMLDHVTQLLGEAENLRVRAPIEAVEVPKPVTDAAPTTPMPDDFVRAPAYYVDRITAHRFSAGAEHRRTEYHVLRVQTQQGVDELNTLSVPFDPTTEEAFVNRLDVYDDTGRPVATGDAASYFVVDRTSAAAAAGERALRVPVPGLRPGYRIELVATVRSFVAPGRFPYLHTFFGLDYPTRRQALVIDAEVGQLAWSGTAADSVRRAPGVLWWQAVDLSAFAREPFSPDPAETEPSLFVADNRGTWESATTEYLEQFPDLQKIPTVVEDTARELTAGLEGSEAKLLAVAAFVQREIALRPATTGKRSLAPQATEKTLTNRFGGGADIALLLAQMLACVGVESPRPALVNTDGPVQEKLAVLEQFNHMVVFLPQGETGRVIDAADKQSDARLPVPLRLIGRQALVIDSRTPRLVRLPPAGLEAYRAEVSRKIRFDDAGTAHVAETVTFHDHFAAAMRGRLRPVAAADRADFWQARLRAAGTLAVVRTLKVERLDDLTEPLVVTCEYDVERALTAVGAGDARQWVGALPAASEATLTADEAGETRRRPIDFPYTLRLTAETEIEPPPGTTPQDIAGLAAEVNTDLLTAKRTAREEPGVLKLSLSLTRPAGRHPANRYDDYRQALREARTAATPTVRFAPKVKD